MRQGRELGGEGLHSDRQRRRRLLQGRLRHQHAAGLRHGLQGQAQSEPEPAGIAAAEAKCAAATSGGRVFGGLELVAKHIH